MKRSGLKRKTELGRGEKQLRADPEKVRQFLRRTRGPYAPKQPKVTIVCARDGCEKTREVYAADIRKGAKFCSRACFNRDGRAQRAAAAAAAKVTVARTGAANPNYKHGKRAGANIRGGSRKFKSGQSQCVHPLCEDPHRPSHEHHVVYEQHVKREGGDRWDPRNALRLCVSCHSSHHRRGRVVPLVALRDENYEFAAELLGSAAYDYLRRRYAGEDPRLDMMLRDIEAAAASSGTNDPRRIT